MQMLAKKLDFAAFWIAAILLAILPFHAFLFTWFHSFFWQQDFVIFVQAWKEILVGVLGILALMKLLQTRELPRARSFLLGATFILLAVLYAIFGSGELAQRIFGLRTATLFLILFLAIQFFDFGKEQVDRLKKIVLAASGIVILFALLQKFLLPADFLKYFGYSENISSWLPGGNLPIYHTVGESGVIRLQSTLAGPNQLGAYLVVILPLAIAETFRQKRAEGSLLQRGVGGILILGGLLTLFLTFSRSAWLGLVGIGIAFAILQWKKNLSKKLKLRLLLGGVIGILALGILGFTNPSFRETLTRQASTSAHLERSVAAAKLVITNPLGLGLGKSAGISQRFEKEITPENTYLGVALETGWLGGMLFLALLITLLLELKKEDSELFYSLLGIAVIALFLHPLEDTPTALTLFLLAGVLNSPKSNH